MDEESWDKNNLLALVKAEKPDWAKILQRLANSEEEAFLTDPWTKMNAVHYIVLRRRSCPSFEVVRAAVKLLMAQNSDAAVACDMEHGFTPLAFLCESSADNYLLGETNEQVTEFLRQDAELITCLHEDNDIAMDIPSKRGLSPLALHVAALSRLMHKRQFQSNEDNERIVVDVSVSPVLEVLLEKSSLGDCSKALNTLFISNTASVMEHYVQEEQRALGGQASEGLENGWWLLDLMVQILFAAHNQLYRGQTITNFSPLHTLTAMPDVPICFLLLALRADETQVRKPEKVSGNLPIHNVAQWDLPIGDPITRKSICLTTLLKLYPESDDIRNNDGETPTDIYYRTTNTIQD